VSECTFLPWIGFDITHQAVPKDVASLFFREKKRNVWGHMDWSAACVAPKRINRWPVSF
jgi:hypothetical protein